MKLNFMSKKQILSVERLDGLTVETATKLLNFTKMKEDLGKVK